MTKTQLYFLLLISTTVFLFACQREPDFIDPVAQQPATLSSKDPKKLSAAIKVWHGVRTQGTMPAPRGNALELETPASATVQAFNGRYVVLYPEISRGDVLGYYVQVQGASEHFKVDYTKPRITGRMPTKKTGAPSLFGGRTGRTQSGNADSAIVIALPANLQVPDTICVSYCAYDPVGNVSNVITTCIIVNSVGTTAAGSWLHGTWRMTANWDSGSAYRDTIIYNRWVADDGGYQCLYDSLSGTSYLAYLQPGNNSPIVASDSAYYSKAHLSMSSTGGLRWEINAQYRSLDLSLSSCTQSVYLPVYVDSDTLSGAWSYNPATGKAIYVFEFDDGGLPVLEAWEYNIIKVNNRNFILQDPMDQMYIRFEY